VACAAAFLAAVSTIATGAVPDAGAAAASIEDLITFAIESWKTLERAYIASLFSAAGPQETRINIIIKLKKQIKFFICTVWFKGYLNRTTYFEVKTKLSKKQKSPKQKCNGAFKLTNSTQN
jgi:hypothetical protein